MGLVIGLEGLSARVFIDGSIKLIPVEELEPLPILTELTPDMFRVALIRRRLEHPLTDQLLSFKASRTRLYIHQFLPVKKVLESPDQRLLIADEVGTGKTIEAGLIWAELEARAPEGLQSVWVVCPKSLTEKWQNEMLQRFDFRLELLTSDGLRQALTSLERDGILPPRFAHSVVNLELLRSEDHVIRLRGTSIAWDYVIFDEAHHLRNPETLSNGLARFMCEKAKTAVFLTATPLQTSLEDIVNLMETLGVDVAVDPRLLEEQIRWDMDLNDLLKIFRRHPPDFANNLPGMMARLERTGGSARPGWERFKSLISGSDPADVVQRAQVIQTGRDIQILSPYMTRTLRSDFDEDRPIREPVTRIVQFNPAERQFYEEVYKMCLERAQLASVPPGFATQMPERRTASCAPAVADEILRRTQENEEEEHQSGFTNQEILELRPLALAVLGTTDSKFEALTEMLHRLFSHEIGADRAMVFSTFRGTLRYLADRLRRQGFSLDVLHGDIPPREEDCQKGEKSREQISAEFRHGDFQILLASEVAGEGLDFEHCHVVINYDLPWNPMRVEQRIGRCDRIGQKSPKIYIGSLASDGTIEARILSRLYERLGVFERALGEMELILGEQIAAFEHDVFAVGLSKLQQDERLDRIAQVGVNQRQQEQSINESSDIFLAGRSLLEADREEIREAEVRFLSPSDIANFVLTIFDKEFPKSMHKLVDDLYEITGTKELNEALRTLLRSYPSLHNARTEINRFSKRLEVGKVRASFEAGHETDEFVHVRHPLVLLARSLANGSIAEIPLCRGVAESQSTRTKMVVWAIGSLEGYTSRAELLCAAVDCESGDVFKVSPVDANKVLEAIRPLKDESSLSTEEIDVLVLRAETFLLSEFQALAASVRGRNSILTEKAKQAI